MLCNCEEKGSYYNALKFFVLQQSCSRGFISELIMNWDRSEVMALDATTVFRLELVFGQSIMFPQAGVLWRNSHPENGIVDNHNMVESTI